MSGAAGFSRGRLLGAYRWACALDVAVMKPGNVSVASAGHRMTAGQFEASAEASGPALLAPGSKVGERVERAVQATREAVGCNTNLGILLLCAPLAAAFERARGTGPEALRRALREVLDGLDLADARQAFRAIALARPAGLGRVAEQDVADPPGVDLGAAMRLAADRDRIARQYASGYADVIDFGLAVLSDPGPPGGTLGGAVQRLFTGFLASAADTHIVRKLGAAVAQSVTAEAADWHETLARRGDAGDSAGFAEWDRSLKRRGINPGTSADLSVATLFVAAALDSSLVAQAPGDRWHGFCMPGQRDEGLAAFEQRGPLGGTTA